VTLPSIPGFTTFDLIFFTYPAKSDLLFGGSNPVRKMVALESIITHSVLASTVTAAPAVLDDKSSTSSLVRRKKATKCETHIHLDNESVRSKDWPPSTIYDRS
jgi:hypothetical protein